MGCSQEKIEAIDESKEKKIFTKKNQFKLFASIYSNNIREVEEIIERGFYVNFKMPHFNQRSALHIAAETGSLEIVEYLVSKNADIDIDDEYGLTPIFLALRNNHKKCVIYLEKAGAKLDVSTKLGVRLKDFIPKGHEKKYTMIKKAKNNV